MENPKSKMKNPKSKKVDPSVDGVKSEQESVSQRIRTVCQLTDKKQKVLQSAYDCLINDYNSLESKLDALIYEQDKVSGRVAEIEVKLKPDSNIYAGVNAVLEYKKTHEDLKEKAEKEFDDNSK